MIDWTASMQQTFEFYLVDPATWKNIAPIDTIISGRISYDLDNETLGSANFKSSEVLDECYIRPYLVCTQNGKKESFPLGTFLAQTPSMGFNGRLSDISIDAYTPLLELKDSKPPYGYGLSSGFNVLDIAARLIQENTRIPVVASEGTKELSGDFLSDFDNDSWLTFLTDLVAVANYYIRLDELGQIIFVPYKQLTSLQPIWTFDDGNSSILYPDVTVSRDLYSIPNVVEVLYSNEHSYRFSRVENKDPASDVSTKTRGREIVHRVSNPEGLDNPTQEELDIYAKNLLKELSTIECKVSFSHGYCGVRVGDCVLLNYERAGLKNVKAKVTSQSIECRPGCKVSATAVYTKNYMT